MGAWKEQLVFLPGPHCYRHVRVSGLLLRVLLPLPLLTLSVVGGQRGLLLRVVLLRFALRGSHTLHRGRHVVLRVMG